MAQIDVPSQTYQNNGQTIDAHTGRPVVAPVAPVAPVAAPTPSPVTMKDLYGSLSPNDQAINDAVGVYRTASQAPVDEAAIRADTTKRLQAEIDATNGVFAEKMRQAHVAGENRLGQNAAISARRGLLGSDFGAAQTDTVNNANSSVYSGIGQEQAAAIASITDKGAALARQEIADKNAVKQQSASDYITFLSKQDERRTTRTSDAAKRALAAGIDLSSASAADIKAIADSYQISPDALVSSYVDAKNAAATTAADIATKQASAAKPVGVPTTDNTFQLDPKTGQYKQTGTGTPTDSALKEYQYAVQNDGFTGSLADWKSQIANQKVTDTVTHSPIDGSLQIVPHSGPGVAGTGKTTSTLPAGTKAQAVSPVIPPTGTVANPYDKLSGSDLAYAQSGLPQQAKYKFPVQIDEAEKRIRALIPNWTPANAAAQYTFFKSPTTQTFIANSNTVLNTLDQIKQLSAKVPRTSFTIANNGIIALKAGISDPNAAKLVQLATIAGDEAGKLLGGSNGSDFTTALGISLVNPNYSQGTFDQTIDQLGGRVRNKVSEYYSQGGQTNPTGAAPNLNDLRAKYNY